jgi:hypothetical protein
MAIQVVKYEPHPYSRIIPPMADSEFKDLVEDIRKNDLLEAGVLFEDKLLDGNSRQKACVLAGREFRIMHFEQLPKVVQDAGPVALVVSRNVKRRHLTPTQRAVIAADALPLFEAEAKKRQVAGKKIEAPSAPEGAQGFDGEVVRGRAAAQAAKATGSSTRSVQRAKALKQKDPKKFADAKAGKTTLVGALRDKRAEAKAAKAAAKAAKGLRSTDSIVSLLRKASATGKLSVELEGFKIVVTRLKAKKAVKAQRSSKKKAKR